jgi:phospholipid/cholesterol/gamma-HCH transport system substrate-binding protein
LVSKTAKIRLGVFVLVGILLLSLFVAVIIGNSFIHNKDTYFVRFHNYSVAGLQIGGAVNYRGIQVGKVEKITIDPKDVTSVILRISVDHGTPIKTDNEAVLMYVGITGIKAVEIQGGTNSSRLLKPGSYIKAGSTQLEAISDKAVTLVEKIDRIASNLDKLTGEENRNNVASILSQTSELITETRSQILTTLQSLNQIASSTTGVTEGLGINLTQITQNLTKNLDSLSVVAGRNIERIGDKSTASLDSIALATRVGLEQLTNELSVKLDLISTNLTTNVNAISNQTQELLAESRSQLNNLSTHSDEIILQTSGQIAEMSIKINSALDRVNGILASSEIETLLANLNDLSQKLNDANVSGVVGELSVTLKRAGNLINNIDRTLISNRTNLNEIIEALRETSDNLNEFSRQISDNPNLLLKSK